MKKKYYLFCVYLFFGLLCYSQTKQLQKANQKYNQYEFIDATEIYKEVAKSGFVSEELLVRLSNSLFFNAKYNEAAIWYQKLYALKKGKLDLKELLRYSQSLRSAEKNKESKKIYNQFLKKSNLNRKELTSVEDYLDIIEYNSNRYSISKLEINSNNTDFGVFKKEEKIYFSSSRNDRKSLGRIDKWSNEPFLDIYTANFDTKTNTYSEPRSLNGKLKSKFHDSSIAISNDGNTIYFTRSNNTPLDKNGIIRLKIYQAKKNENGKWDSIKELPFNGENFSCAHPALNPSETKLYYASNMLGGYGGTDIYEVNILPNNKFGKPLNLGAKINTKGRESFPFITSNNELYFSSDGHYGLGGYDVYYIDLKENKEQQLLNVGKPVNGNKDDYAFSIDHVSKKGFFSSNRGKSDNIYDLLETNPIQDLLEMNISGLVEESNTNRRIPYARITLRDTQNKLLKEFDTDSLGAFKIKVNRYKSYTIRAEKELYSPDDVFVPKKQDSTFVVLKLKKNIEDLKEGVDIASILNVVIYFDFDKYDIRKDAEVELEKIYRVLLKFPSISLDLRAHTDSKGPFSYNKKLSQKRAEATMNYLLNKGISADRLTAEGFGEEELKNNCKNGVKCSSEEHQENRRTEFVIRKK
jgi:outer membrane protein OmpA-like peptidoglycan-associated protein